MDHPERPEDDDAVEDDDDLNAMVPLEVYYDEDDGSLNDPAEQLAACIRHNTAAQGADFWAVEVREYSAADWAEMTGRDRSTVSRNVSRAYGGE